MFYFFYIPCKRKHNKSWQGNREQTNIEQYRIPTNSNFKEFRFGDARVLQKGAADSWNVDKRSLLERWPLIKFTLGCFKSLAISIAAIIQIDNDKLQIQNEMYTWNGVCCHHPPPNSTHFYDNANLALCKCTCILEMLNSVLPL